jgi:hypothetical protein
MNANHPSSNGESEPLSVSSLKLRKLLAMGPRELAFRISRKGMGIWHRMAYQSSRPRWSAVSERRRLCANASVASGIPIEAWWLEHMQNRSEPPFLLDDSTLQQGLKLFEKLFPERIESAVGVADRVVRGEFSFVGIDFVQPDPIQWQSDPTSRRIWERRFFSDVRVPFCDGASSMEVAGDPKHVWELNRHEFLIDCAKAYYLTKDERFARRVFQIMSSWIAENPYHQGINWAGPLEVATRALSWLWAFQFCRGWGYIERDCHFLLIKSFYEHGVHLHRHLEFYTSANNHLVGEATALYCLGCFFPEFDESRAWRRQGWRVLETEFARQFYEDGGSTEQATYYHNYCLGFFLIGILLRQRRDEPVAEPMLRRLEKALEFTMWLTTSEGTVPRIGDVDDARSIRFENPPLWDFRNLLSLGAVLFSRSDMKAVAAKFSEDAVWLLGLGGYERYEALDSTPPIETTKLFRHSGYGVMRSGWSSRDHHLCFDCGPIAEGLHTRDIPSSAHGHADMLSFTANAFGKPLIVDAGFFTYNGDPPWHRYFREASAHNTICVDGASQARFCPSNGWSSVAKPEDVVWHVDEQMGFVECAHAGFWGLKSQVRHRRAIVWIRDAYWLIFDRLEGTGSHKVEVHFHFSPSSADRLPGCNGVCVKTQEGISAQLQLINSQAMHLQTVAGQAKPDGGWIATSYGRKTPAPVATFSGQLELPVDLTFVLCPGLQELPLITAKALAVSDAYGVRLDGAQGWELNMSGRTDRIGFSWTAVEAMCLIPEEVCPTKHGGRIAFQPTTQIAD